YRSQHLLASIITRLHKLLELQLPVADLALLLAKNLTAIVLDRPIRRPVHLLKLVLPDLVDEHPERGEVRPGGHVLLERVDLALAPGTREDVGAVNVQEAEQPQHLAAVVDLLSGDPRDAPLIVDGRRTQ